MSRVSVRTALALLACTPALLAAQEPERERSPEHRREFRVRVVGGPMIGLVLGTERDSAAARAGARVERVLPGSPAEEAGIQAGDVITRFNTTPLASDTAPARRLSELARGLEPGDSVRLEYRRGDQTRTATVVMREMERGFAYAMPAMPEMARVRALHAMPEMVHRLGELRDRVGFARGWHGLELVDLNPQLGEYFNTREGTLVVDTRNDSLPIRPGDVILRIDGRTPQDAAHAERILASYRPGEQVRLEVMRKQRRETVTWEVAREGRRERRERPERQER